MGHATFTYVFYENEGSKRGISLPANVTHSIDAYLLRSMHRRCNYDLEVVQAAYQAILSELELRVQGYTTQIDGATGKLDYYIQQYVRSSMPDVVILPWIKDGRDTQFLSDKHLTQLRSIVEGMLAYAPFELVTIHDAFKAHPNNCNYVRFQYKELLAELAESNILSDILTQIHGVPGSFPKLSTNLGEIIRGSNYALS